MRSRTRIPTRWPRSPDGSTRRRRGVTALANRVDQLEATHVDDLLTGLAERIDGLDGRVETVAVEIKRAKTLWPVALRSLEARLDDVAPPRRARR